MDSDNSRAFDAWWNEIEVFSPRSERAYDDIRPGRSEMLPRWMRAAFDAGVAAAQAEGGSK